MKFFIPAAAVAALVAGAVQASPLVVDGRNAAEINFGSTHPGTITARSGLSTQDRVVLRPKGEVTGIYKEDEEIIQARNYNTGARDEMETMSGIKHRIPSK